MDGTEGDLVSALGRGRWWVVGLRTLGVVLGVGLAVRGQLVLAHFPSYGLDELSAQRTGGMLLVVGSLVFSLALPLRSDKGPLDLVSPPEPSPVRLLSRRWLVTLLLSLALTGYSIYRCARKGEDGWVVLSWAVSLVGLFAMALTPGFTRPRLKNLVTPRALVLLGILSVAAYLRFSRFTLIPLEIDGDYASCGLQAREIATSLQDHIFGYGWAGIPLLGYMPSALTMRLIDLKIGGCFAAAGVEGLLIILGTYLLGRDLFGVRPGLVAAALLAISHTHIHFSRTCAYIDPVVFLTFGLLFFLRMVRWGGAWNAVLFGANSAMAFLMYFSGRVIVPIVGTLVLILLAFHTRSLLARWREALLATVALVVTLGPNLYFFVTDLENLNNRSKDVLVLAPHNLAHEKYTYHVETVSEVMWQQGKRTILMLHHYSDGSTQFGAGRPFLDLLAGTTFALGACFALARIRKLGHWFLWVWTVLTLVFGCLITINPPFWPRLLGLLPPTALLAALGIEQLLWPVEGLLARKSRTSLAQAFVAIPVALALWLMGSETWRWYSGYYGSWARPHPRMGRFLNRQPVGVRAYLVGAPGFYVQQRELQFLSYDRLISDIDPASLEATGSIPELTTKTLVLLDPANARLEGLLKATYPDGVFETYPSQDPSVPAFHVFRRQSDQPRQVTR